MLKYKIGGVDIQIEIDRPGVYQLDGDSATGKTYLFKLLRGVNKASSMDKVITYTYDDKWLGVKLDELARGKELELVVIDRYDMFLNEYLDEINELGKEAIVLIDSKQDFDMFYNFAGVMFEDRKLTVKLL